MKIEKIMYLCLLAFAPQLFGSNSIEFLEAPDKDYISPEHIKKPAPKRDSLKTVCACMLLFIDDRMQQIPQTKTENTLYDTFFVHLESEIENAEEETQVSAAATKKILVNLINDAVSHYERLLDVCFAGQESNNASIMEGLLETVKKENERTIGLINNEAITPHDASTACRAFLKSFKDEIEQRQPVKCSCWPSFWSKKKIFIGG